MAISHAGHNHPATAAARKACRNSNDNPNVTRIEADGFRKVTAASARRAGVAIGRANEARARQEVLDSEIKMTGPVARRMAKHAAKAENARIQPKRSGARVSSRNTSCVQAALHIDAHGGRCACGWEAQVSA